MQFEIDGYPEWKDDLKCKTCKKQPAEKEYYSQTSNFFRNGIGDHFYFCGETCKSSFNRRKKCRYCNYQSDLIFDEISRYSYCNATYKYWDQSCFEKYLKIIDSVYDGRITNNEFEELIIQLFAQINTIGNICETFSPSFENSIHSKDEIFENVTKIVDECSNLMKIIVKVFEIPYESDDK